jgi:hypothetical protein
MPLILDGLAKQFLPLKNYCCYMHVFNPLKSALLYLPHTPISLCQNGTGIEPKPVKIAYLRATCQSMWIVYLKDEPGNLDDGGGRYPVSGQRWEHRKSAAHGIHHCNRIGHN